MENTVKKTRIFFLTHSTSSQIHFFRVGGNEVHAMSHLMSCPNRTGRGFFLKTVLSARQTLISRCGCRRGVILSTEQTSHVAKYK